METARAWGTPTNNRDGQAEVIAFLADRATHHGAAVERVDTHISALFLAADDAFKLKRAVRLDYLDFSTPELRRHFCEEEVRVNRRTAPAIYKGVVPVTREADGSLALGGAGEAVDWVVHMARFDQSQLLDRLANGGALSRAVIDQLGRSIAAFHGTAAVHRDRGGIRGMQIVVAGNALELHDAALSARTRAELRAQRDLLEDRRRAGFVRECHGDLHLGNIVLIGGVPTLFDAIEFNEDIACIDVLYDIAFLIMDLRHRGSASLASALWNAYLEETGDYLGLPLLPLFLSCRAAVRAKISMAMARVQQDAAGRDTLTAAARHYLVDAQQLLGHRAPIVIAIGGPSGSGKSTVAAALAPAIGAAPGAVVLRSDVIRKQICGVGRLDRLGAGGYRREVSARVYTELAVRARQVVAAGYPVIVDATFLQEDDRRLIEDAAAEARVAFHGVWLDAADDVLVARLRARQNDPSDADAAVLAAQRAVTTGHISWQHVDAENPRAWEEVLTEIRCNAAFPANWRGV